MNENDLLNMQTGIFVKKCSFEELEKAVCFLRNNPSEAKKVGESARKHNAENFDKKNFLLKYLPTYSENKRNEFF